MKNLNIKNLSKLVLVDFISVSLFYLITRYFLRIIKGYYELIQGLTPNINLAEFSLQQNTSLLNINELGSNLNLIGELSNKILGLLILLGLISFLIYNISQSINWNLVLNEFKFKDFKKYLKKFSLVNIPIFLISSYLIFKIITKLRPFILDFWFKNLFNKYEFFIISLLSLIFLFIVYLSFLVYILINKHSLKESFYLLNFKKIIKFLIFLLTLFVSSVISIFVLRINPNSIILTLVSLLIFLTGFNILRYTLPINLKINLFLILKFH